jgi:hypothetical protein
MITSSRVVVHIWLVRYKLYTDISGLLPCRHNHSSLHTAEGSVGLVERISDISDAVRAEMASLVLAHFPSQQASLEWVLLLSLQQQQVQMAAAESDCLLTVSQPADDHVRSRVACRASPHAHACEATRELRAPCS